MEKVTSAGDTETSSADDRQAQFIQLIRDFQFEETLQKLSSLCAEDRQKYCWELLPLILSSIDEFQRNDVKQSEAETFDKLVDNIISSITDGSSPKELLLMYIETLHSVTSLYVFELILEHIGECLTKHSKYPLLSLIWAVDVVSEHLRSLPPPTENPDFENSEQRKLMDLTDEAQNITDRYRSVLKLLKSQIKFMNDNKLKFSSETNRLTFCLHLTSPLATTFGLLDLCPPDENKSPSAQYIQINDLVSIIETIIDPVIILELSEGRRPKSSDEDELKIGPLNAAVLAYVVFAIRRRYPRVYSAPFLAELHLFFSQRLLQSPKHLHILKGLDLLDAAMIYINLIKLEDSLKTVSLRILKVLFEIMTACTLQEARQKALLLWRQLFAKFEPALQEWSLSVLFKASKNPSVRGFILDISRQHLAKFEQVDGNDLVDNYVSLPNGETTDLLEESEYLLASLAYLRHMYLKRMVIKSPKLEKYLDEFKRAIQLTRAHYELQLKSENSEKLNLLLPEEAKRSEKEVLQQALTRVDLMESLLGIVQNLHDAN